MQDVVEDMDSGFKVCGYEHEGFVETIDSIEEYYDASMKLMNLILLERVVQERYAHLYESEG